jgi:hypothetical protein
MSQIRERFWRGVNGGYRDNRDRKLSDCSWPFSTGCGWERVARVQSGQPAQDRPLTLVEVCTRKR